jgi:hypothetical protein
MFLPTPPGAYQIQLLAVLFEYRVIARLGPLPAAACGRTLVGDIAPQRYQHLQPQASESLDPRALGQRPRASGRGGSYPSLARGTGRCWYGTRTAEDTSLHRSRPTVSVGSASALRSRRPSFRGGPSPPKPVGGPQRPIAPGGSRARGAPALYGGDAVWLRPVLSHIVSWKTWCVPSVRVGLVQWQSAQAHTTPAPARL